MQRVECQISVPKVKGSSLQRQVRFFVGNKMAHCLIHWPLLCWLDSRQWCARWFTGTSLDRQFYIKESLIFKKMPRNRVCASGRYYVLTEMLVKKNHSSQQQKIICKLLFSMTFGCSISIVVCV